MDGGNVNGCRVFGAGQQRRSKGTHSWYPVCRSSLDQVVGLVSIARLLQLGGNNGPVESAVEPAAFVPETLSGMELIEQFRAKSARMVFRGR